jgi:hypothetical protein
MSRIETGFSEEVSSAQFASSTRSLRSGVDVPASERKWSSQLAEYFQGLDLQYQDRITQIISGLRQEDPKRAVEIAKTISEFFARVGDAGKKYTNLEDFLRNLETEIKDTSTGRVN